MESLNLFSEEIAFDIEAYKVFNRSSQTYDDISPYIVQMRGNTNAETYKGYRNAYRAAMKFIRKSNLDTSDPYKYNKINFYLSHNDYLHWFHKVEVKDN